MTHICLWCWSSQTFALTFSWFYAICDKVCVILWMRKHSYVQVYKISGVDCRKQLGTTIRCVQCNLLCKTKRGNEKRGRLVRVLTHHTLLHTTSDSSSRYVWDDWNFKLPSYYCTIGSKNNKIWCVQCSMFNMKSERRITSNYRSYCRLERHI